MFISSVSSVSSVAFHTDRINLSPFTKDFRVKVLRVVAHLELLPIPVIGVMAFAQREIVVIINPINAPRGQRGRVPKFVLASNLVLSVYIYKLHKINNF